MASKLAEILDLRSRPDLRRAVIEQNLDEWGLFTGLDYAAISRLFTADNPFGTLPVTLVAVVGDRYAGCASLRDVSMGAVLHPESYLPGESPWLSNVWVADFARGAKLASRLTLAIEEQARILRYPRIFCSTSRLDSLYHKLGYRDLETRQHADALLYLTCKDLA